MFRLMGGATGDGKNGKQKTQGGHGGTGSQTRPRRGLEGAGFFATRSPLQQPYRYLCSCENPALHEICIQVTCALKVGRP